MEQNQVENDYVEQTVNDQTPPKRSKKWWAVLIIVIIIIAIGGGYYYWNLQETRNPSTKLGTGKSQTNSNDQASNDETVVPTADSGQTTTPDTPSTTPKATTNETADWKTYENTEIGLSFRYPVSYGDFQISINNGEVGKKFVGNFQNDKYFSIGGITANYTAGRSGYFLDFVNYLYEGEKYYHLTAINNKRVVEPIKTISVDNQKILVVSGNSYIEERNVQGPTINPGSNGGALINLPGTGEFKGVAVWNSDINVLPQSNFEEILSTFQFTSK